ncbi:MAG: DUF2157 domain-containing protein [Dechloromonas sp.]|nr:DUF2157 domain-containing protein [Dechloromonas sp.]
MHVFRNELARLADEDVLHLDAAQRAAVDQHHEHLLAEFAALFDVDRDSRAKRLSLGMRVASFLGAPALAASIFFLFYQFWGHFAEAAQVGILIVSALASFGLTMWLQAHDATRYFAKLAALVAVACFVLSIMMLGQIFNITPTDNALLPCAAMAFLLAYSCDLRLLLAAGICCVIAWFQARVGAWHGVYWLHAGERPENFFPVAALLFVFPSLVAHRRLPGFAATYRVFGLLCLFIPLLILSHRGWASHLDLDPDLIEGGLFLVVGVTAVLILLVLKRLRRTFRPPTGEGAP